MDQVHETLRKVQAMDAEENVLFICAHDDSVYDLELYPLPANEWKRKGWKERIQWTFVKKFKHALEPKL